MYEDNFKPQIRTDFHQDFTRVYLCKREAGRFHKNIFVHLFIFSGLNIVPYYGLDMPAQFRRFFFGQRVVDKHSRAGFAAR